MERLDAGEKMGGSEEIEHSGGGKASHIKGLEGGRMGDLGISDGERREERNENGSCDGSTRNWGESLRNK